jgi:hypothetical protein
MALAFGGVTFAVMLDESRSEADRSIDRSSQQAGVEPTPSATPPPVPSPTATPPPIGPRPRDLTAAGDGAYAITDAGVRQFDPRDPSEGPSPVAAPGRGRMVDIAAGGNRFVMIRDSKAWFLRADTWRQTRAPVPLSKLSGRIARTEHAAWLADNATSKLQWVPDRGRAKHHLALPGRATSLLADDDETLWAGGETASEAGYVAHVFSTGRRRDYPLSEGPTAVLVDHADGLVLASQPSDGTVVCIDIKSGQRVGLFRGVGSDVTAIVRVDGVVYAFDRGRKLLLELRYRRTPAVRALPVARTTSGVLVLGGSLYGVSPNGQMTTITLTTPRAILRRAWAARRDILRSARGVFRKLGVTLLRRAFTG